MTDSLYIPIQRTSKQAGLRYYSYYDIHCPRWKT